MTAPDPPSFRARLEGLLDEYDGAPRGTTDALLAAYVRACLSSRDALELRVAREARRQGGSREPQAHDRPAPDTVTSTAPLYAHDPRPEVTGRLAAALRRRTEARDQPRDQAPVVSS